MIFCFRWRNAQPMMSCQSPLHHRSARRILAPPLLEPKQSLTFVTEIRVRASPCFCTIKIVSVRRIMDTWKYIANPLWVQRFVATHEDLPQTQPSESHSHVCPLYRCQLSLADLYYLNHFRCLPIGVSSSILSCLGTLSAGRIVQWKQNPISDHRYFVLVRYKRVYDTTGSQGG